jgi:hypothetical protein
VFPIAEVKASYCRVLFAASAYWKSDRQDAANAACFIINFGYLHLMKLEALR